LDGVDGPGLERRGGRRRLSVVGAVVVVALTVAGTAAVLNRPIDHHYLYRLEYASANGAPFDLILPLPADPDLQSACRFLGNGTAVPEASPYGRAWHVKAAGNISVACRLDTWKDLPITLSTEGNSVNARPSARAYLDSRGLATLPTVVLQAMKTDSTWTLVRDGTGDLFEGWNALELRQSQERTPAY
jgi:hypothetical protein